MVLQSKVNKCVAMIPRNNKQIDESECCLSLVKGTGEQTLFD